MTLTYAPEFIKHNDRLKTKVVQVPGQVEETSIGQDVSITFWILKKLSRLIYLNPLITKISNPKVSVGPFIKRCRDIKVLSTEKCSVIS
jgi:hypothetical protein